MYKQRTSSTFIYYTNIPWQHYTQSVPLIKGDGSYED